MGTGFLVFCHHNSRRCGICGYLRRNLMYKGDTMKIFSVIKKLTYCDPVIYGPSCWETTDPNAWKDHKGKQHIWTKHARSRAILCIFGYPVYTLKMQDTFIYWYKFWDLDPIHLPPWKTKEPLQILQRLKSAKDNESTFSPLK